jgi:hypothetical protein
VFVTQNHFHPNLIFESKSGALKPSEPVEPAYAECYYAECLYAECHYTECLYAECYYTECLYAECRYSQCYYDEYFF